LVANYSGGNISVFPIAEDGSLGAATHVVPHIGVPTHHDAPHPHSILHDPQGRWVLVPDCGLDRIAVYTLDTERGVLIPNDPPWVTLAPGAGPRHLAFHPSRADRLYCINERNSTLTTFAYEPTAGVLRELQTVSTLPDSYTQPNSCADIHVHPSGRFVYGSNRGHDSIACFAVDEERGTLRPIGHLSTGGQTPRNFAIDPAGQWLLAANQDSDSIQSMHIDVATGELRSGPISVVASPVCVFVQSGL
jgi:6-phosphogluconolactonase